MSVLAKINESKSTRARVALGAVLATVAAGGVMGIAMHKNVTVDVDGSTQNVSTMALYSSSTWSWLKPSTSTSSIAPMLGRGSRSSRYS